MVGLVAHVRDALDALVVYELGDLLLQGALVDHVGNLGKDQAAATGLGGFHVGLGTHGNGAATGLVALPNAGAAHDDGAGGEVRTGHDLHKLVDGGVGIVDQVAGGLDRLGEVMRGDIGGHADGDALTTVDQQVGKARGQRHGLGERLVVVGLPVDGILLQVAQQLHGRLCQAALGITHGRRAVSIHRTEVSMSVNQRITGGPVLCHINQGSIDRTVTVRMIFTHGITNDTCAFSVWFIRTVVQFNHREQYSSLYRL